MEKWWKMLVPLVNIKIAGKWMVIPPKMVLIGIDPYPNDEKWWEIEGTWLKTIEKTWHGMGFFKKESDTEVFMTWAHGCPNTDKPGWKMLEATACFQTLMAFRSTCPKFLNVTKLHNLMNGIDSALHGQRKIIKHPKVKKCFTKCLSMTITIFIMTFSYAARISYKKYCKNSQYSKAMYKVRAFARDWIADHDIVRLLLLSLLCIH